MSAPHVVPFLPGFIPPDVDMEQVLADVADDGVSAPEGADVEALREVVRQAAEQGIDLKIVVIPHNPPIDTPLRDIATEVGMVYPDATVLAMSPSFAGTYSRHFDRVTLEHGEDYAETGDPVVSAQNFVAEITKPDFPWTAWTILLVVLVAAATVLTRVLQVRAKRAFAGPEQPTAPERPEGADQG